MRLLTVFLSLFIGLAACGHAGGRHGLFHKREDVPAADLTASKTSSSSSSSSSSSQSTGSSTSSNIALADATSTPTIYPSSSSSFPSSSSTPGETNGLVDSKSCLEANSCKRDFSFNDIAEESKCPATQLFSWNVTIFYHAGPDYGFGPLLFANKEWYKGCTAFMPTTLPLGSTYSADKLPRDKFTVLEAGGDCVLQIMPARQEKLSLNYNDLWFAAQGAIAVMEAAEGRIAVGGHLQCEKDDYSWRFMPKSLKGEVLEMPYEKVPTPWEVKPL